MYLSTPLSIKIHISTAMNIYIESHHQNIFIRYLMPIKTELAKQLGY